MTRSLSVAVSLFVLSGSVLALGMTPPDERSPAEISVIECRVALPGQGECVPPYSQQQAVEQQAQIDVVFVLDTTGSMGGLIEGAKQKIWAIANQIAQAQPSPVVRMGLVGYRDRGDEYVTTITPLTEDIDSVYSDLMSYQARGGGDSPESVNEALFQAIERFEWSSADDALKLVYLVGDAPPKMNYTDDVKYQASCRLAAEQGININTILCGGDLEAKQVWQEIAQISNGAFAMIEQSGGVVAVSTPFDQRLAELDRAHAQTMIDYGDDQVMALQMAKRLTGQVVSLRASAEAAADRATYNSSKAGRANLLGKQELVADVADGTVNIEEVDKDQLPSDLQAMSNSELKEKIEQVKRQRDEIAKEIKGLVQSRSQYLKDNASKAGLSGFDQKVLEALVEQGKRVGISFDGSAVSNKPDKEEIKEPAKD